MAHLLIDTVKTSVAGKFLPASRHTVRLFAGKRTAKPLRRLLRVVQNSDGLPPPIALTELPRKKDVPAAILDQARAILAADPQANIAVVSPRANCGANSTNCKRVTPTRRFFPPANWAKKPAPSSRRKRRSSSPRRKRTKRRTGRLKTRPQARNSPKGRLKTRPPPRLPQLPKPN